MSSIFKNVFSPKTKGIGIEITPAQINIAQLKKDKQNYKLVHYLSVEVPEGIFEDGKIVDSSSLALLIQQTLSENKLKVKRVATAVPMREAIIRIIPIPAELDEQELREMVLSHEAALYLPYPREEVDLDYQKLGFFVDEDGIEKVQVLLVATRKEVTDLYLNMFRQAGLQIDVLEITSFALIRTLREQLKQFSSNEAAVLVDIEFDSTEIAIIVDGVPQFSRTVPIGTYQMQIALAEAMNLPATRNTELLKEISIPKFQEDGGTRATTTMNPAMPSLLKVLGELVDELRRSINFYLNQRGDLEVAQLLLAGPGGGIGQIDEFFTQRLGLPAIQVDPVQALALDMNNQTPSVPRPGLGVVLGLGMREV